MNSNIFKIGETDLESISAGNMFRAEIDIDSYLYVTINSHHLTGIKNCYLCIFMHYEIHFL